MTGPRHLWSGDWERESVDADATHTNPEPQQDPQQQPEQPAGRGPKRRRPGPLQVMAAAAAVLVIAGVAVGLTAALNGGSAKTTASTTPATGGAQVYSVTGQTTIPQTSTSPQTQSQPQTQTPAQTQTQTTASIPNLPTVDWLGMQIITGPAGPEVTTVGTGAGNADGFQPEDVISTFDNQNVQSALQISKIAATLPLGTHIPITVLRGGGSLVTMAVTMKERPTVHP